MTTNQDTIDLFLEGKAGESPRLFSNGNLLWIKGEGKYFAWWTGGKGCGKLFIDGDIIDPLVQLFWDACLVCGEEFAYEFHRKKPQNW